MIPRPLKELPYRSLGLDAARGIALLLMMATHCLRVAKPSESPVLARWLLHLEPLTPTLFFLLAGAGLAYSRIRREAKRQATRVWLKHQIGRALVLWAISLVIFLVWHGPQWPASLTSTGVLQTLGVGILLTALLERPWLAATIGLITLFFWVGLDKSGVYLDGINQGSFPFFPWIPFVMLGYFLGTVLWKKPWIPLLLWGASLVVVGTTLFTPGWFVLFDDWGVATTKQMFQVSSNGTSYQLVLDLWNHAPLGLREQRFWAPLPQLFPILFAAVIAFVGLLLLIERYAKTVLLPFALLGRHSLSVYIGSLMALGPLFLLPATVRVHTWGWALFTLLFLALGLLWSGWRDTRSASKSGG